MGEFECRKKIELKDIHGGPQHRDIRTGLAAPVGLMKFNGLGDLKARVALKKGEEARGQDDDGVELENTQRKRKGSSRPLREYRGSAHAQAMLPPDLAEERPFPGESREIGILDLERDSTEALRARFGLLRLPA